MGGTNRQAGRKRAAPSRSIVPLASFPRLTSPHRSVLLPVVVLDPPKATFPERHPCRRQVPTLLGSSSLGRIHRVFVTWAPTQVGSRSSAIPGHCYPPSAISHVLSIPLPCYSWASPVDTLFTVTLFIIPTLPSLLDILMLAPSLRTHARGRNPSGQDSSASIPSLRFPTGCTQTVVTPQLSLT